MERKNTALVLEPRLRQVRSSPVRMRDVSRMVRDVHGHLIGSGNDTTDMALHATDIPYHETKSDEGVQTMQRLPDKKWQTTMLIPINGERNMLQKTLDYIIAPLMALFLLFAACLMVLQSRRSNDRK